ncbi:MAG: hypothetical protein E6Q97_12795 [Desulfurellales bacterium]|nr:MAG: hypothetical protein E6Q97_12795 [Desulfurellales bacterium]
MNNYTSKYAINWVDAPNGGLVKREAKSLWLARPKNRLGMNEIRSFCLYDEAIAYAGTEI